jgi:hypothetical protein
MQKAKIPLWLRVTLEKKPREFTSHRFFEFLFFLSETVAMNFWDSRQAPKTSIIRITKAFEEVKLPLGDIFDVDIVFAGKNLPHVNSIQIKFNNNKPVIEQKVATPGYTINDTTSTTKNRLPIVLYRTESYVNETHFL